MQKRDRFKIIQGILIVMMTILVIKLFDLTILNGTSFREQADKKRFKNVQVTAVRGNIYDRNGTLLAGTRPTFAVQIMKDDFNMNPPQVRNEALHELTRYLELEGALTLDDYVIGLNEFAYTDREEYFQREETPKNTVLNALLDADLLESLMTKTQKVGQGQEAYTFSFAQRTINAMRNKHVDVPIKVQTEGGFEIVYDPDRNIPDFLAQQGLSSNAKPARALAEMLSSDRSSLRKVMGHPVAREMAYQQYKNQPFFEGIELLPYVYTTDLRALENKAVLNRSYPEITPQTLAKDDFVVIAKETALETLLTMISVNSEGDFIVPAAELIDLLDQEGVDAQVEYVINQTNDGVNLHYVKDVEGEETPLTHLINLADRNDLLEEFLTSDKIKRLVQEAMQANGVNPHISVISWMYTFDKNKADFLEKYRLKETSQAEEAFFALKDHYKAQISDPYTLIAMFSIYQQVRDHGLKGYQPVNLVYNISEETIARIEENIPKSTGIQVGSTPVRYYPNGDLAAHVLGYIGKIATPMELEKYTADKGYGSDQLIGKTGIEESFEQSLKGVDGVRQVEVNSAGNPIRTLSTAPSIPGNDLYLTLDAKLQKDTTVALDRTLKSLQTGNTFQSDWGNYTMERSRNARNGAVVVVNVKTGETLTLVSAPDYDPNLFATGISQSDWENLAPDHPEDPLAPRPLLNIAMQTAIQPGSTYKLATALAALEAGQNPESKILDSGYLQIGDTPFGCWIWNTKKGTHGYENLYQAIRDSCNYYFYALAYGKNQTNGEKTDIQLTVEDMMTASDKLGLTERTGVEIQVPVEARGRTPSPKLKRETTKAILRKDLNRNLALIRADDQGVAKDQDADVERILSWLDLDEELSRNQIISNLTEMGYNAEVAPAGQREGLADKLKYTYMKEAKWTMSDMMNTVIGQGQNSYTPLQMVRMTAAFGNGGYKTALTLVDRVVNGETGQALFENTPEATKIPVKDEDYFNVVRQGMNMVAKNGTAGLILGKLPIEVAIKTGTAEVDGKNVDGTPYNTYSWTVALAPYEDPEIAIVSVIFQGGAGSVNLPLIREVVASYFDLQPPAKDGDQEADHPIEAEE